MPGAMRTKMGFRWTANFRRLVRVSRFGARALRAIVSSLCPVDVPELYHTPLDMPSAENGILVLRQ